jgi:predicted ester cyclase
VTKDEMIEVFDRHEAAENARDAEAAAATYVEDGYYLNYPLGARFEGRQGVMLNYAGTFGAFPDFGSERTLLVAGEDFLYEEGRFWGTFDGPFLSVEPTGKRADVPFASYISFRDGLMLGEHIWYDGALLAEQLGISLEQIAELRAALGP